ncbi:hypothetical protein CBER1_00964 [Cercospora berteroae]|uniref:Mid2 domain-containing protein n=1 Tax=Cercospora berteroae TaxID=357750 RepID=A0A2S6C0Z6_9PEZI|nr:hypothetical protein CBER1_00964 [Cercospora berteroae]
MFSPWLFTLLSLSSPSLHPRKNDESIFITPPGPGPSRVYDGNPVWRLNSSQRISWTTNITSYRIELWQQNPESSYAYSISTVYDTAIAGTGAGAHSTSWDVQLYTSNLTFSPIYFFWLKPNRPDGITSHYFNITAEIEDDLQSGGETVGSSVDSSTAAIPSASRAAEAINTTAVANDQDVRSEGSAGSLSPTLKIGIGLGVGLGVPFLLIAGAFIGLRMRRSRRNPAANAAFPESMPAHHRPRYVEHIPIEYIDGRGKQASIYQLSDYGKTPQLVSRAELG